MRWRRGRTSAANRLEKKRRSAITRIGQSARRGESTWRRGSGAACPACCSTTTEAAAVAVAVAVAAAAAAAGAPAGQTQRAASEPGCCARLPWRTIAAKNQGACADVRLPVVMTDADLQPKRVRRNCEGGRETCPRTAAHGTQSTERRGASRAMAGYRCWYTGSCADAEDGGGQGGGCGDDVQRALRRQRIAEGQRSDILSATVHGKPPTRAKGALPIGWKFSSALRSRPLMNAVT
jgi:hypothetical protein